MTNTSAKPASPPRRTLLQSMLGDRVLLGAFAVCILLIGYQLGVILLQPPWIKLGTDWLRAALAWPQLFIVAWVSWHLVRTRQPGAAAWCCVTLGLLSYAIARTTWTLADVLIYPHGVPFPSLPDLFFILQFPCFASALFLIPAQGRWLPGVRVLVDGLLWMSSITALSWYFVLQPLSLETQESPLGKSISLYYQVADLLLFYGLVAALARSRRTSSELVVTSLLSLAVLCLLTADTWAALLLLHPPYTYRTGSAPDLFWFSCYLLIPLAALARLCLFPGELPSPSPSHRLAPPARLSGRDMLAGVQFALPSVVGVGAGVLIIVDATVTSRSTASLIRPETVATALLLLAALRPAVTFLEQEQLRRERDTARAEGRALQLANERMETHLGMVAHELKTPLTTLIGNVQLMARRLDTLLRRVRNHEEYTGTASMLHGLITWSGQSLERMARLVEDMLDETRVRQGRLALRLAPCDVVSVVGEAVAEQRTLHPERAIHWVAEASPVPVLADAIRLEQVVANYVSNALKFSRTDQAVEVRVGIEDGMVRVAVHDDGVGIPLADQPHIWERFYQAEGVGVKSGSQVGFGLGLYISKVIVEGHQGQVGVESAPGQGTTIWFALPLATPKSSSYAAPPAASSMED